jgi:hypothetical protein
MCTPAHTYIPTPIHLHDYKNLQQNSRYHLISKPEKKNNWHEHHKNPSLLFLVKLATQRNYAKTIPFSRATKNKKIKINNSPSPFLHQSPNIYICTPLPLLSLILSSHPHYIGAGGHKILIIPHN